MTKSKRALAIAAAKKAGPPPSAFLAGFPFPYRPNRTKRLTVDVSDVELRQVKELAELDGKTVSDFVRDELRQLYNQTMTEAQKIVTRASKRVVRKHAQIMRKRQEKSQ